MAAFPSSQRWTLTSPADTASEHVLGRFLGSDQLPQTPRRPDAAVFPAFDRMPVAPGRSTTGGLATPWDPAEHPAGPREADRTDARKFRTSIRHQDATTPRHHDTTTPKRHDTEAARPRAHGTEPRRFGVM